LAIYPERMTYLLHQNIALKSINVYRMDNGLLYKL